MAFVFKNKIIWITGASAGIGSALAVQLSQKGARLILSGRDEQRLKRVVQVCSNPERHTVLAFDLADPMSVQTALTHVIQQFTYVDVLINNAGVSQRALAADTRSKTDRELMEINFFAPIALTKGLLPIMQKRRQGYVVAVASVMGKVATQYRSTYSASKHALLGFMNSLRAENADKGIAVTVVCPGFVRTGMSEKALTADGDQHGHMDESTAQGIMPPECAAAIIRAMQKQQHEVLIAKGKPLFAWYLNRFSPSLARMFVQRVRID
ncbi:MAG: SDR family oxidoreductase [Gammaproteobacteria bacterium]|nr:SDR family oxidoreductase [Gammaproteobacteria bacterium]